MSSKIKLDATYAPIALHMLKRVTDLFDKYGIRYTLASGTLLGIIRENRLLPWDNDIDLHVFNEDIDKFMRIRWRIWLAGFTAKVRYQHKSDPPLEINAVRLIKIYNRQYFLFKGPVLIDCFVTTKHDGYYKYSCGGKRRYTVKAIPEKYYNELGTHEFNNSTYSIPDFPKEYLEMKYGPDWQIPKTKWNYAKDDKAIIATDHQPRKKKKK